MKPPSLFVPLPNTASYMLSIRVFIDGLENFSITGYPEAITWLRSLSHERSTDTTVQFLIIWVLYIVSEVLGNEWEEVFVTGKSSLLIQI